MGADRPSTPAKTPYPHLILGASARENARSSAGGCRCGRALLHRRHARVEDRNGKTPGCATFHDTAQNRIWLAIAVLAADLLAWTARLALPAHVVTYDPAG